MHERWAGVGGCGWRCDDAGRARTERERRNVECEEHEVLLVIGADTIVDPRTVVVHLDNAPVALGAVMGARRLETCRRRGAPECVRSSTRRASSARPRGEVSCVCRHRLCAPDAEWLKQRTVAATAHGHLVARLIGKQRVGLVLERHRAGVGQHGARMRGHRQH